MTVPAAKASLGAVRDVADDGRRRQPDRPASDRVALQPRLLSVELAAAYCSVSVGQIYALLNAGVIHQVSLPIERDRRVGYVAGTCRRVLIDRDELDALIPRWKTKR